VKVCIIGGGRGGRAILDAFYNLKEVEIVGICDKNMDAPGIVLARQLKVPVYSDFNELIKKPGLNLIFEVTGNEKVSEAIINSCPPGVFVVNAHAAKLMMDLIEKNNSLLRQLEEQAQHLAEVAQEINQAMKLIVTAIEEIAQGAKNLNLHTEKLSSSARETEGHLKETGSILEFIQGVGDQTKLLGLNAAIEAARAGEHGRGFTIVAQEIRKMADNSANSAKQINVILKNIEKSVTVIVHNIEEASNIIQKQAAATSEVVGATKKVNDTVEQLYAVATKLASIK